MTYEEIKKKYPIGKIIKIFYSKEEIRTYYYTENDLKIYREKYGKVNIINDSVCSYIIKHCYEHKVEGWIFDGKEWMPAYDTWDGWIPIPKESLEEIDGI